MEKAEGTGQVRVRLLGPPAIERNGEPAKVETRKAFALLAYLAVERRSHARASLVALLWPEADESRGRAVLRRTLHALSQVLPPGVLHADRDHVALGDDPRIRIDVEELREAHRRCVDADVKCAECPLPLRAAADLYRDDFLAGFTLKDSVAFDDWQFGEAEVLRRLYAALLDRLVGCLVGAGDHAAAIECASRWLSLDNLDEAPHIALMKLHALAGRRAAALKQYESCRALYLKELGEEPSARVGRLARDIRSGSFPTTPADGSAEDARAGCLTAAGLDEHPATVLALRVCGRESRDEAASRFLSSLYGLVVRYGGRIESHVGPIVLIVFGRGPTRESAPELAVRAAIELRAAGRRAGMVVTAGISSGAIAVPVATSAEGESAPIAGPAVTDAKRLAASATGEDILVSESTYRATRGAARYARMREPGDSSRRYRLGMLLEEPRKARGIEGLGGVLVGRDEELAKLRQALDHVARGDPRLVTVCGAAGVGKSRLVAEGRAATRAGGADGILWLEGRCLDVGVAAAYWPFIDLLRQYFSWRPEDADGKHIESVEHAIDGLDREGLLRPGSARMTTRYLLLLLSATVLDGAAPDPGTEDPESLKAGIFGAVRDLLVALARSRPLVLVLEDLHWADALTLDLISYLMDSMGASAPGAPPAWGLLCLYRSASDHRCRHIPTVAIGKCPDRYIEIVLHDLTPDESARLVEALLRTREVPEALVRAILDRSQGNPFFLEEIVRSLIDTGVLYRSQGRWHARAGRVADEVPESVESVIRGATDRLPAPTRRALRAASVMGRVFDPAVLGRMVEDPEAVETHLRLLEDSALIYEERTIPRREYSFRHVLTRDAVYAGIPPPERRELHELVAETILRLFGERQEPYLERLAYHYESAGLEQQAVRYLHQAGLKAIRSSDNPAAIRLLERARELVRGWSEGAERSAAELETLVALGVPVTATTGYGSRETRRVYQSAVDLCAPKDRSPHAFAAAYGLWRYHMVRGEISRSLDMAARLGDLSRDLDDDAMRLEAQRALGSTLWHAGKVREADRELQAAMADYDPARHRSNAYIYGHDPATTLYYYHALCLWHLGFPDRAAAAIDRLCQLMRDSTHRLSLTYTYSMCAQIFQLRGDVDRVLGMSSRAVALAAEGHLPMFGGFADVMQGWARSMKGDAVAGVELMREGVGRWEAASGGSLGPYLRSLLADAMRRSGDPAGAARLLEQTVREMEAGDRERNFEPEIYRILGEIAMEAGETARAEPLLRRAAAVAESTATPSLGLRAAASLARLQASRGERASGRQLVQEALGALTEGRDTADHREAIRLARELR